MVSDGVFNRDGEFLPLPGPDATAVMEVFRRLFLQRLHRAERLSETLPIKNRFACPAMRCLPRVLRPVSLLPSPSSPTFPLPSRIEMLISPPEVFD